MLNSKQRSKLKSYSSELQHCVIIGKEGLTETVLKQIEENLFAHEIVKVSVLESAELSAKDYLLMVSEKLGAEQVCSIGRKFVIYKLSTKKGIKHLEI